MYMWNTWKPIQHVGASTIYICVHVHIYMHRCIDVYGEYVNTYSTCRCVPYIYMYTCAYIYV